MNTPEYEITVHPPVEMPGDEHRAYKPMPFTIEPPIQPTDEMDLNGAFYELIYERRWGKYWFGDFPLVNTELGRRGYYNIPDAEGNIRYDQVDLDPVHFTHHTKHTSSGVASIYHGADPEGTAELVERAFTQALQPLGHTALRFNLDALYPKAPEQQ